MQRSLSHMSSVSDPSGLMTPLVFKEVQHSRWDFAGLHDLKTQFYVQTVEVRLEIKSRKGRKTLFRALFFKSHQKGFRIMSMCTSRLVGVIQGSHPLGKVLTANSTPNTVDSASNAQRAGVRNTTNSPVLVLGRQASSVSGRQAMCVSSHMFSRSESRFNAASGSCSSSSTARGLSQRRSKSLAKPKHQACELGQRWRRLRCRRKERTELGQHRITSLVEGASAPESLRLQQLDS